jgi:hypothetical protein
MVEDVRDVNDTRPQRREISLILTSMRKRIQKKETQQNRT